MRSLQDPRSRLVSLRLTEEEFKQLQKAIKDSGYRSMADFTRDAILNFIRSCSKNPTTLVEEISALEKRVEALEQLYIKQAAADKKT